MKKMGGRDYQLWDEQDGFFYDVLRYPNGEFQKFRLRSLVGLIPLYAIEVLDREELDGSSRVSCATWNGSSRTVPTWWEMPAMRWTRGASATCCRSRIPNQFKRLLQRIWDPEEFLSPYGIRSLSKYHEQHPFQFGDRTRRVRARRSGSKN